MTNPELAAKILELLGPNGENWTKDTLARNKNGSWLADPRSSEACKWCLGGALLRCMERPILVAKDAPPEYNEFLDSFAADLGLEGRIGIGCFNDSASSYAEVRGKLQALAAKGTS